MTTALDKIIRLAGGTAAAYGPPEDTAGELILAAEAALFEVWLRLADSDDDEDDVDGPNVSGAADEDEDEDDEQATSKSKKKTAFGGKKAPPFGNKKVAATMALAGGGDDDDDDEDGHAGHATYKKLVKKGVNASLAEKMCAKADNKQAAATAVGAAMVALAALQTPEVTQSWPERTASGGYMALAAGQRTGGTYAGTGRDGRKLYPLGTDNEVRLSWTWACARRAPRVVKDRIRLAASSRGIDLVELAVLNMADRRKASAHTIGDSTDYPIPDKAHLGAAIARYKQGKLAGHSKEEIAAHIRSRAKALGEEVDLTADAPFWAY